MRRLFYAAAAAAVLGLCVPAQAQACGGRIFARVAAARQQQQQACDQAAAAYPGRPQYAVPTALVAAPHQSIVQASYAVPAAPMSGTFHAVGTAHLPTRTELRAGQTQTCVGGNCPAATATQRDLLQLWGETAGVARTR
jgi:hypothetical protein